MTIAEISQFKDHYEKEEEKKGAGSAVYGKDQKLKPVSFKKGKDDGVSKLHPARFELRMPLSVPKKYWHKIPARREVYRHFPSTTSYRYPSMLLTNKLNVPAPLKLVTGTSHCVY